MNENIVFGKLVGLYADDFGNLTKVFYDEYEESITIVQYLMKGRYLRRVGMITILSKSEAEVILDILKRYKNKLIDLRNK